jgi:hypothetical protein
VNSLILDEAAMEAAEAAIWYELRRPGLGVEFTEELRLTQQRICDWPEMWPRMDFYDGPHDIRRCFLNRRFPYRIIFWQRPEDIIVVAVAHMRRRPLYWLQRLR